MGRRVPEDYSLVVLGFDFTNKTQSRAETAVVHPLATVMAESVRMLVERIEGRQPAQRQLSFPFTFQSGRTLAPVAPGNPRDR
jgi:DNA-binding LacI/PurR family transcriptional regulator